MDCRIKINICMYLKKIESTWLRNTIKKMDTMMKNAIATLDRDSEIAFAYNVYRNEFSFFNKKDMVTNIKQWKEDIRQHKLNIGYENCATAYFNGKKYYTFVLQYENVPIDPTGYCWENSSFVVNGFIYYFRRRSNRDIIIQWINS